MKYIFFLLQVMLLILSAYNLILSIYYTFLSFMGFGKAKKDYEMIDDKATFLILVAAHNEEAVIGSTLENLRGIDYNPNLYDIIVVNDNSTDKTGAICDELGFKHVDTAANQFPREGVGKPAGIQYALRELGFEKLKEKYDLLMILDADNHVDSNILKEVNSQYYAKHQPEVIQVYLDSKNAGSTLSLGYSTSYTLTNRFFQLAKYRLGLPNAVGGTGFAVNISCIIDKGGFCFKSLTEDLELEIKIVIDGGRILWNHFTRIYDEKPDKLKASLKQRIRWSQGHWYVAFTNGVKLIQRFFYDEFKWKYIDQLFYLFTMGRTIQLIVSITSLIISFTYLYMTQGLYYVYDLFVRNISLSLSVISIINILQMIYTLLILLPYAVAKDSKQSKNWVRRVFSIYYYAFTFLLAQIIGLFKWRSQHKWVKTEHKHNKKIGLDVPD